MATQRRAGRRDQQVAGGGQLRATRHGASIMSMTVGDMVAALERVA
jgi:hypothetical protein